MARSPRRDLWIVVAALVVAVLAAAALVVVSSARHGSGSAASRGEAIFQAGIAANGAPIPRSAGSGGMMGGGMMGGGCATCHGSDGHGRSTMMFSAPNITYGNLTDPQGMLMPDGTRGPTYTDAAIRTAVTTGIDPTGAHLEWPMPQWQLSGSGWSDLLAYLKTLK